MGEAKEMWQSLTLNLTANVHLRDREIEKLTKKKLL